MDDGTGGICGVLHVWSMRQAVYVELIMLGGWYRRYMWSFACLEYERGGVCGVNYVWKMRLAMCMWS